MAKHTKQLNHDIKNHLSLYKKKIGVTSKQIAVAFNVSPQTVSAILMTADELSLRQLTKLSELFKMPAADLLGEIMERSKMPSVFNFNQVSEMPEIDMTGKEKPAKKKVIKKLK